MEIGPWPGVAYIALWVGIAIGWVGRPVEMRLPGEKYGYDIVFGVLALAGTSFLLGYFA